MIKVIKRNGDIVDFNRNKIYNAIRKCIIDVGEVNEDKLSTAKLISIEIEHNNDNEELTIEQIQDEVEKLLMTYDLKDEAKSYILYREKHKEIRNKKERLYNEMQEKISSILNTENIENSNTNVDEYSTSGQNKRIIDYVNKNYALENILDKDIAEYHRQGLLYQHDLDMYSVANHNCITVDFTDLFENNNGFKTRNTDVRKPNSIMTFFQLVAVVFQLESQCQFGK